MLTLDRNIGIDTANCECPRGNWICSHMAAAAIFANKKGLSKTDLPNSWLVCPKKHQNQQVTTIPTLFSPTKSHFKAISREVSSSDMHFLHNNLSTCPHLNG